MSETVIPFFIPAGQVVQIPDPAVNTQRNCLQVVVLSGGPVFGWTGRKDLAGANADVHPSIPQNVEFDFAGAASIISEFVMGELGTLTLFSDNQSIGYLRIIEYS